MKLRNGSIINQVLPALELLGRKEMPVLSALKVRKMLRLLREHARDLQGLRNELLQRWGKKDEDGKLIILKNQASFATGEDSLAFAAAVNEMYSGEWEYPGETLTVDDLGNIKVGGAILADLCELLCVDGEQPEEE